MEEEGKNKESPSYHKEVNPENHLHVLEVSLAVESQKGSCKLEYSLANDGLDKLEVYGHKFDIKNIQEKEKGNSKVDCLNNVVLKRENI